eukprot:TRINITY_DN5815_c0_g1_i1.p1 TRINITY_DN5815_c0_g1~~TRINITY_DN5815_c0_g1_i1.p1  ORF type:complete len:514 (-),score=111.28 TRINITY_DN5815_c0_g1_i1:144-1685(-)
MNKRPDPLKSSSAEAVLALNRHLRDDLSDHQTEKLLCYFNLPQPLKEELFTLAYRKWDHARGVKTLLRFWLLLMDSTSWNTIRTPRYIYGDKASRLCILRRLQFVSPSRLVLDMYTFYQRKKLSTSGTTGILDYLESSKDRNSLDDEEAESLFRVLSSPSIAISITELIIPNIVNENILQVIMRRCLNLKDLNVNFSVNVDDSSILSVFEDPFINRGLRTFFADGTSLTSMSLKTIFEAQPSLERLLVDEKIFEDYLLHVHDERHLPIRTISLAIKRDYYGDIYYLGLLACACPYLEEINIEFLHRSQVSGLGHLAKLEFLNKLAIGYVGYPKLSPLLNEIGHRLTCFKYCYYGEDNPPYLSRILELLPNLVSLSINAQLLHFSPYKPSPPLQNPPITLKFIHFNIHALISKEIWTQVMTQCLGLESLELTTCEDLEDESLISLVLKDSEEALSSCRHLSIRGRHCGDVKLTEKSVEALYARCKDLETLEDTSTWSLTPCSCTLSYSKLKRRL